MSQIIWAMRSNNATFSARKSAAGLRPAVLYAAANAPTYDVDATAIGGHNYNLDSGSHSLVYPAQGVFSNQAFSILMRMKFTGAGTYGVLEIGSALPIFNLIQLFHVSDWRIQMANGTPATILSSQVIYNTFPALSAWTDVLLTSDGLTTANAIKLWIDGSVVGSLTGLAAQSNPKDPYSINKITLGSFAGATNSRALWNEVVIWDYVIDPSAIALTSGSGALNGASRTAFVDVAPSPVAGGSGLPSYEV